jgi:hypothetical protein
VKRVLVTLIGVLAAGAIAAGGGAAPFAHPPRSNEPPSISGTPAAGSTLTASTGSWSGDTPMSFRFQWRRCSSDGHSCNDIGSATAQTYALTSNDVGHRMRVVVTATNSAGSNARASEPTAVIATAGQKPNNTVRPSVAGDFHEGGSLAANVGKWSGSEPISYAIQWERCGGDCHDIDAATGSSYVPTSADVGKRIRIMVAATNKFGSNKSFSPLGPVVASRGSAPANTAAPAISGSPQVGQVLTLVAGTWKGSTPMTFAYGWQRCNSSGANCAAIPGASGRTYRPTSSDVGFTLRGSVTATNKVGRTSALTNPTAPITVPLPSGAIKLPNGLTSLPVSSVSPPERLVIDQVSFSPSILRSRDPFTASFRVRDTRGYVIRDALVLVVAVPFGRVKAPPETVTATDGVATLQLVPTARLPLINGGSLVLFVRARKPGDNVLAGVSNRRLVSIRTAKP